MGAAAIHFAYSPSHLAEYWLYGVFFIVLAWAQLLWAVGIVLRPWRWLLLAGYATNAVVILIWGLSRTIGVLVGPNATVSEAATFPDVLATVLEALAVVGALVLLAEPGPVDVAPAIAGCHPSASVPAPSCSSAQRSATRSRPRFAANPRPAAEGRPA